MSNSTIPIPTPTPTELEDLIYFSRTADLTSLKELLSEICTTHKCSPSTILASSIDIDSEGLGSQSSLLHYPAANGNLEIIEFLLSLLKPSDMSGMNGTIVDKSAPDLVNHKNINGNTPLHWAGMNGHLDVVKALIKAGANPTIVNSAGRDAVVESEWSEKVGAKECAQWMLENCSGLEMGSSGGRAREEQGEAEQQQQVDDMDGVKQDMGLG